MRDSDNYTQSKYIQELDNEEILLNDLSVDREAYLNKEIKVIPNTLNWKCDNRGIIYNSNNKPASFSVSNLTESVRVLVTQADRTQVWMYVNKIVLELFVSPAPSPDHVPWHIDGDRSNCRYNNLTWVIPK